MKLNSLPKGNGPGNWLQRGVHRVIIMGVIADSNKNGTPYVEIEFADAENTARAIKEKFWTTDGNFQLGRFHDLYSAVYPTEPDMEIPDDLNNADAHGMLLIGRILWISVDRWDERYYWGVTAMFPDSETMPGFIPAWKPKDADVRPWERGGKPISKPQHPAAVEKSHPETPGGTPAADDDIPF